MLKLWNAFNDFRSMNFKFSISVALRVSLLSSLLLFSSNTRRRHVNVTPSSIDSFRPHKSDSLSRDAPLLNFLPKVPTILIMPQGSRRKNLIILKWHFHRPTVDPEPVANFTFIAFTNFALTLLSLCANSPQSSNRNLYVCLSEFIFCQCNNLAEAEKKYVNR